jgi:hypothetical protein
MRLWDGGSIGVFSLIEGQHRRDADTAAAKSEKWKNDRTLPVHVAFRILIN